MSFAEKPQEIKVFKATQSKNQAKVALSDEPDMNKITSGGEISDSSTIISPIDTVTSNLLNWIKAWQARNTPVYLSFYTKNFKPLKKSRSKWKTSRRRSLEKASNISIKISNIKAIILGNETVKVTFVQQYESDKYSDTGIKELIWKKYKKSWKITKESWKPR